MKSTSADVRREFIQLWAQLARSWGVSAATARVYAWLFSQLNGGDVDEIMAGLKVGRGTVSMACRELKEWGLVTAETQPGSRRTRYFVETDLGKVIRNIVLHRKSREWDPIVEHARDWIPRLEDDRTPEAGLFRERLRVLAACMALADGAIARFLGGSAVGDVTMQQLIHPPKGKQPSSQPR